MKIVVSNEYDHFLGSLTDISAKIKSLVPKRTKQSRGEDILVLLVAIEGEM